MIFACFSKTFEATFDRFVVRRIVPRCECTVVFIPIMDGRTSLSLIINKWQKYKSCKNSLEAEQPNEQIKALTIWPRIDPDFSPHVCSFAGILGLGRLLSWRVVTSSIQPCTPSYSCTRTCYCCSRTCTGGGCSAAARSRAPARRRSAAASGSSPSARSRPASSRWCVVRSMMRCKANKIMMRTVRILSPKEKLFSITLEHERLRVSLAAQIELELGIILNN